MQFGGLLLKRRNSEPIRKGKERSVLQNARRWHLTSVEEAEVRPENSREWGRWRRMWKLRLPVCRAPWYSRVSRRPPGSDTLIKTEVRENGGVRIAARSGEGAGWTGTRALGEKMPAIVKMRVDQCQFQGGGGGNGEKVINVELVTRSGTREFWQRWP